MNINEESIQKKTAKQLEKEAKKLAKLEKFKQKQEQTKLKTNVTLNEKKNKKKDIIKKTIEYCDNTPFGEKKDVSGEMPKAYSPTYVEAVWYSWWEKQKFFKPEYGKKSMNENIRGKFIMVIPPPNVTGTLHLGHALTNAIQDALTRWNRMKGRLTLWNPGCDHAGIATQVVVENKLWRECKKTRHDLGREEFIKKIWEWKEEKGDRIYTQLRKLGSSLDWDRACFTMEPKLSAAVTEAFVRLHENGDIYRSNRLVNWSCSLKSAISDIEVDKIELTERTMLSVPGYDKKIEFGVLIYFAYEVIHNVEFEKEYIVVATTRIETMLSDSAVAVHPDDERYKHLHGKFVIHPFCDRKIPIVCDSFVDREFGTGAVKISPAHDKNDYEVGIRHNLAFITIFSDDGRIIGNYGKFTGMKRFDARVAVLETLKENGLFRDIKNNAMVVPICNRSKDIIEPLIKPQWYIKCDDLAKNAMAAVNNGELKIIPEYHVKIWNHWMENIKDWCISRQLWWGHRIPAYRTFVNDSALKKKFEEEEFWISGRTEEEAKKKAAETFGIDIDKIILEQDVDVLDTWFSSGLFPFSVFGWPDNTEDMEIFYPNTLLETGHDILFFWVARMVFFGQKLLNKLPFKEVFLHPMVRDAHGRKMSKSLGNVIDPVDVIYGISLEKLHEQLYQSNLDPKEIEKAIVGQKRDYPNGIPECGTDALRFALCAYMSQGRDINLDILRVQGYRFFCNKIWNAVRFTKDYMKDFTPQNLTMMASSPMNLWILSRLAAAVELCNKSFEKYEFNNATAACYNLWLYDLCDVFLECVKPVFASGEKRSIFNAQQTLIYVLDCGLRLLSPFMPYITEELYQRLPIYKPFLSICVASYPESEDYNKWRNEKLEQEVQFVQKVVHNLRSAQTDYNLPKSRSVIQENDKQYPNEQIEAECFICCTDDNLTSILQTYLLEIKTLAHWEKLKINETPPSGCAVLTVSNKCQIHLSLRGSIDVNKEHQKLKKSEETVIKNIDKIEKMINAPSYETKVPFEIRVLNSEKLIQLKGELSKLEEARQALSYILLSDNDQT
ncbi:hypothetical protein PGB90_001324 [Kerria lacca]